MKRASAYFKWLRDSIYGFFYMYFVVACLIILGSVFIAAIGLVLEYFGIN